MQYLGKIQPPVLAIQYDIDSFAFLTCWRGAYVGDTPYCTLGNDLTCLFNLCSIGLKPQIRWEIMFELLFHGPWDWQTVLAVIYIYI